ncbi:flap endonuclease GEN homolog 1 [Trichomycterus rosablanca]|uniref:flap endonuclease GEN homolog 1 n=1 Tax=Trichomycterus rosablanca TaxID=2290929 RepID=UPI002F350970
MGVNDLWSILSPVQESVPLYSLTGKTLAVDLSLWICEAQHVQGMMGRVTKPHLRNLFFRASSVLRMGIKLIFVMEGEAPKLKAETMKKRTETAFRTNKTKSAPKPAKTTNTSRGRFMAVLRECAEMLDYLGLPWVAAAGEAEAMCAFMDAQGLVDGCITSDGDAFLYGARTVYRNFNMNTKDPQIECYKMSRVETELQLKRETLVGLAVLLGCDYIPKGVPGVGKEQTLKLIQNLNGQTLLQKFSDWGKTASETLECAVKKVTHCLVCRHPGSAKSHEQKGCVYCDSKKFCQPQDYDSECPCDWHRTEHARQAFSVEASIKKKTLACDLFPFSDIINEYLISKDKLVASFKRRKPSLLLMQKFALEKMEWPKHYTSEKVLALMTYTELMNRRQGIQSTTQIQPIRIYKRRIRSGVSCFEVMWIKPDHYVFPEDCPPGEQDVVRTVEEENLFNLAFPDIVDIFNKETAEPKDNKLKKKKKVEKEKLVDTADGISDIFAQMSLQSSSHPQPSSGLPTIVDHPTSGSYAPKPPKQSNKHKIQDVPDSSLSQAVCQPEVPASTDPTDASSQAQNSLSVSAVIEELHLSNIDWEALSFTAAPSPQNLQSKAGLKVVNKSNEKVKDECTGSSISGGSHNIELPACPLRESDILRKEAKVKKTGCKPKNAEFSHMPSKPLSKNLKGSLSSHGQTSGPSRSTYMAPASKEKVSEKKQQTLPVVAPTKYKFVKVKHSNGQYSNPQPTSKETGCKKSVCVSQGSSSDENHPETEGSKNTYNHKKTLITQTVVPQLIKPDKQQIFKEQNISANAQQGSETTMHEKPLCVDSSRTNPKSQDSIVKIDGDDDDSFVSISSPLPLAERLKLKFIK